MRLIWTERSDHFSAHPDPTTDLYVGQLPTGLWYHATEGGVESRGIHKTSMDAQLTAEAAYFDSFEVCFDLEVE